MTLESLKVAVFFEILQFWQLIGQKCLYYLAWLIDLSIPTTLSTLVMRFT